MLSECRPTRRPANTLRIRLFLPLALLLAALGSQAGFRPAAAASPDLATQLNLLTPALARPYLGCYQLRRVTRGAPLDSSTMVLSMNVQGHLQGLLEAMGTDARGGRTSWLVDLANFHFSRAGQLTGDVLGQGFTLRLGRLALNRERNGDLAGQLTLGHATYAAWWHRMATARS